MRGISSILVGFGMNDRVKFILPHLVVCLRSGNQIQTIR